MKFISGWYAKIQDTEQYRNTFNSYFNNPIECGVYFMLFSLNCVKHKTQKIS